MSAVILVLIGYVALFGAGLVGKYLTGFDSGYCMSGIVVALYTILFLFYLIRDLRYARRQVSPEQR